MNSPEQSERKRRVRISLEEAVRETLAEGVPSLKKPKRNARYCNFYLFIDFLYKPIGENSNCQKEEILSRA